MTYADGVPVGLQPVTVTTLGGFRVGDYVTLEPTGAAAGGPDVEPQPLNADGPARRPWGQCVGPWDLAEVAGFEPARGGNPQPA